MQDEPEDRAPAKNWQLDKRIPVSMLIAIFFQTICIAIWATKLDGRVGTLETTTVSIEKFARLDEKMNGIHDDVGHIRDDLARLSPKR